jgi:hypothetical protein
MATPLGKFVYAIIFSFSVVPLRLIMDRIHQSRDSENDFNIDDNMVASKTAKEQLT